MTCQQTQDLLHGYIDGELDLLRNVEIERHFDECQSCALARRQQLALRSLIQDKAPYFGAPDLLTKRIQNAVRGTDKERVTAGWMSRRWLAFAASVALLTLSGLLVWTIISNRARPDANALLAQEVVSSHVRSLMANHLTDVTASNQHTVKPWFDGKLDFAPEVKDLSEQGFVLVGGRLDYVGNRSVAALVYQRRNHYINLFIWPSSSAAEQPEEELSRQGYNLIHWTKAGTSYWAASDLNSEELREFERLSRQ
jgi:anti-sigma factor RsiW